MSDAPETLPISINDEIQLKYPADKFFAELEALIGKPIKKFEDPNEE